MALTKATARSSVPRRQYSLPPAPSSKTAIPAGEYVRRFTRARLNTDYSPDLIYKVATIEIFPEPEKQDIETIIGEPEEIQLVLKKGDYMGDDEYTETESVFPAPYFSESGYEGAVKIEKSNIDGFPFNVILVRYFGAIDANEHGLILIDVRRP